MRHNQMKGQMHQLTTCYLLLVLVGSALTVDSSDEQLWKQVSDQCDNFKSVTTLDAFLEFQSNYDRLNTCLHLDEPPADCLAAEQSCRKNGLYYTGVKILGQLVYRAAYGEPICNIEYAGKIYRLHKQVGENGGWPQLARLLRALANRWSARCRSSLAKRLSSVERRAPDAQRHVKLVANILNIGGMEEVEKLQVKPEYYVPALEEERALDERVSSVGGQGASGFKFDSSIQIDMGLQMLKMSCSALKPYHNNILGSVGLLASVGYAASRPLDLDSATDRGVVRRWLVSAMLCQLLRGVTRMSSVSADGEDKGEILILPQQETDISWEEEQDQDFASYNLPEAIGGRLDMDLEGLKPTDSLVYKESARLLSRKLELINGPSRSLASAIYTYLDLRQSNRMPMANTVLGLD